MLSSCFPIQTWFWTLHLLSTLNSDSALINNMIMIPLLHILLCFTFLPPDSLGHLIRFSNEREGMKNVFSTVRRSCLVMLITGGYDSDGKRLSSSEVWGAKTGCKMKNMTVQRSEHAAAGEIVCGGHSADARSTCETLNTTTGVWSRSHTLQHKRVTHVMWRTLVLGGSFSKTTTEELQDDGSSENSFTLQHKTEYVHMCWW